MGLDKTYQVRPEAEVDQKVSPNRGADGKGGSLLPLSLGKILLGSETGEKKRESRTRRHGVDWDKVPGVCHRGKKGEMPPSACNGRGGKGGGSLGWGGGGVVLKRDKPLGENNLGEKK